MTRYTDPNGLETLEILAHAENFNHWLFESVEPYCVGEILEIGSGIGNISKFLLERERFTTLSDLRTEYCTILETRFKGNDYLRDILQVDLSIVDFSQRYPELLGRFDTIIALNVIEHIENDVLAISNCKKLLRNGGQLIIIVPAFQRLYNVLDRELQHFRRYDRKKLGTLLEESGMSLVITRYFNLAGIAGWWLSGSVFRSKIISERQLKIYNSLVPLFRLLDKFTSRIAGLSVMAIARNTNS